MNENLVTIFCKIYDKNKINIYDVSFNFKEEIKKLDLEEDEIEDCSFEIGEFLKKCYETMRNKV